MDWSSADPLAGHLSVALAPCRMEQLLSADARHVITGRVARRFPGGISTLYGFECRLDEHAANADFLISIGPEPHQWLALSRSISRFEGDTWRRLDRFLGVQADAGQPPRPDITNMWLEFDLAGARSSASLPVPSLFFGSNTLTRTAAASATELTPAAEWLPSSISALTGVPLSQATCRQLASCLFALPEGGRIFQVGVMLSRPDRGVRLCALFMSVDDIVPYLSRIGWPGSIDVLRGELERWRPLVNGIRVDLDVADAVQAGVGLECYWTEPSRTVAFFQQLVADGLCLPEKAGAALGWGGITHHRRYADAWPATLLASCPSDKSSVFLRWLHHVKIQIVGDGTKRAKAYLAVAPAFLSDAEIRSLIRPVES